MGWQYGMGDSQSPRCVATAHEGEERRAIVRAMPDTPVASSEGSVRGSQRSARSLLPPGGFTLRPFEAWTASPIGPALVIGGLFVTVSLSARSLIGGHVSVSGADSLGWSDIWLEMLNAVILVYVPAALVLLRRGIARDLTELRPVLRCSDSEFGKLIESATCVPNRLLAVCCGVFVLAFMLMPVYDPGFFATRRPALDDPLLQFYVLRNVFTGWVVGLAVASEVSATNAYRALGRDHVIVDLLDTRPLHPFARKGLRSALSWILAVSLVSLFWLGPGAGATNGPIIVAVIVLVTGTLFYSVSGVRESIRREKGVQRDALRERIRQRRDEVLGEAPSGASEGAELASLIAYYDLIERAPEWPFDAPMIARLALFATLGLGSWLGGAVVERMLESWF